MWGARSNDTARVLAEHGHTLGEMGRLAEAIPLLEEVYRTTKKHPPMSWVGPALLKAYTKAADPAKPGDTARVVALTREMIAAARATLPKDSPELARQLASFGWTLLYLKQWDEADPVIREALTIREKVQPDAWTTFNAKSMLGAALLGRKKLAEAEPLLLEGYRGMKDREAAIPPQGKARIPEALERLAQLYEAKGNESEAAEWKAKFDAAAP